MDNRENVIKSLKCCIYGSSCDGCMYSYFSEPDCDGGKALMEAALHLLEGSRLNPRKPWHTRVVYAGGESWITDQCPACVEQKIGIWSSLLDRYEPFCSRCGQAIDWSEYDGRNQIDWDEYMSRVSERAKRMAERRRSGNDRQGEGY